MSTYDENKASQLAAQYINNTNKHIFLTGKAGTGKTTFLRNLIVENLEKPIFVNSTKQKVIKSNPTA